MKWKSALALYFMILTLVPACVTRTEPHEHLATCHDTDGQLLLNDTCVKEHDSIAAEKKKERRQNVERILSGRGAR